MGTKYLFVFLCPLKDSELKLLLEKQESLLKELLDFSQRQFAQSDAVALDGLLSQKDKCFEDLQKLDSLLEKWHKQYERPLVAVEQKLDENIQDLLERILISEREFEKRYLASHVRTKFRKVEADEFIVATLLPVQKFKKQSDSHVFAKSRGMI